MNKPEVIKSIASELNITQTLTKDVLEVLVKLIHKELLK
jgi:nucleoid DNA-binding protein